jgi:hypothetical protein
VRGLVLRQNADNSSLSYGGGSALRSAAGTTAITASHTYLASVVPTSGAVGYAWYWGAAGSEKLGAITGLPGIEIKADAAGTQLATAVTADNSKNAYIPDGIIAQMLGTTFGAASGSYVATQPAGTGAGSTTGKIGTGTRLTSDNAGGIVEIDAAFKDRYDNYRLGFTRILMSSQEIASITQIVLSQAAAGTSLFRVSANYGPNGMIMGYRITSYHNKWTGQDVDIIVHPWVPAGTMILWSDRVPYALSNVNNIIQAKVRQGYYQIEWPLQTRQYQFGVYVDEAFENYFLPAFGIIQGIGA